jgi:hypothetical protein
MPRLFLLNSRIDPFSAKSNAKISFAASYKTTDFN